VFRQGRRYRGSDVDRVYENRPMSVLLLVFAAFALALLLSNALARSNPQGVRIFGVVLAALMAIYVVRAVRVQVRITPAGVRVRNILTTRELPWTPIVDVKPSPAYSAHLPLIGGPAYNVTFFLADGRKVRAQALRRAQADATAIANDLAAIARRQSQHEP
jgi:hypothetical protein